MAFSKRHYQAVSPPADTKLDVERRLITCKASKLAIAERLALFPRITAENFNEATEYQEARIAFHQRELGLK